jgi:hypothetical protein
MRIHILKLMPVVPNKDSIGVSYVKPNCKMVGTALAIST